MKTMQQKGREERAFAREARRARRALSVWESQTLEESDDFIPDLEVMIARERKSPLNPIQREREQIILRQRLRDFFLYEFLRPDCPELEDVFARLDRFAEIINAPQALLWRVKAELQADFAQGCCW